VKIWYNRANIQVINKIDELRKVLDPADLIGIKNSYIDYYLKYYLKKHLHPLRTDSTLEIGSGIGRITEFIARYVKYSYGIDLIDKFIEDCNEKVGKMNNSRYIKISQIDSISQFNITKAFIVWVLMYFENDDDLIEALTIYRKVLSKCDKLVIIEQVKYIREIELLNNSFYCKYRTIDEYTNLFYKAGFTIEKTILLGERKLGLFLRLLQYNRYIYNLLPKCFSRLAPILFLADKLIMDMKFIRRQVTNIPMDTVFVLKLR
jgi:SAM-dependent methyltransferase